MTEELEKILKDNCVSRAFMSGGGLRVVRIERSGILVGYGEAHHWMDALALSVKDYEIGRAHV